MIYILIFNSHDCDRGINNKHGGHRPNYKNSSIHAKNRINIKTSYKRRKPKGILLMLTINQILPYH